jgi:hypothetical protein
MFSRPSTTRTQLIRDRRPQELSLSATLRNPYLGCGTLCEPLGGDPSPVGKCVELAQLIGLMTEALGQRWIVSLEGRIQAKQMCRTERTGINVPGQEISRARNDLGSVVMVDARIKTCGIAQRPMMAMWLGFKQQKGFRALRSRTQRLCTNEHAAFKRHVESWQAARVVDLDAAQVVDAQLAFANQLDDPLKTGFSRVGFFDRKPRAETTGMNGKYQDPQQRQIRFIVRTIYKHLPAVRRAGV